MKTKVSLTAFVKAISIVLILSCSLLFSQVSTGQLADDWHDQSDELPGMGSDTGWIIAASIAAVGVATWLIFFNGSDKKDKPTSEKTSEPKSITADSTSKNYSDTTSIKKNDSNTGPRKRDE